MRVCVLKSLIIASVCSSGSFQVSCNKVLLLTLDNGSKEVIARLPFPMAGPPHLLTASEGRDHGIRQDGIIHARPSSPFVEFPCRFYSGRRGVRHNGEAPRRFIALRHKEALQDIDNVMKSLNQMERKFTRTPFANYGSIFFKDDLSGYPASSRVFKNEGDVNRCIAVSLP